MHRKSFKPLPRKFRCAAILLIPLFLGGCASGGRAAPVMETCVSSSAFPGLACTAEDGHSFTLDWKDAGDRVCYKTMDLKAWFERLHKKGGSP